MTLGFGAIASVALIIGAAIGARFELPKRLLAILLSFAAGALITALAFELFEDSYERGGILLAAVGLFAGAVVFTGLSALLDRWAQPGSPARPADRYPGSAKLDTDAAAAGKTATSASTRGTAGIALLAAVTLDGVPENLALGISLAEGTGGIALLAAIFASNFPEALVGAASMREQGRSTAQIIGLWTGCAVLLTAATVAGAALLSGSDPAIVSLPLAFAAGAVIASLADTLMPEAYEHGGPAVALSTAAGFVVSFVLSLASPHTEGQHCTGSGERNCVSAQVGASCQRQQATGLTETISMWRSFRAASSPSRCDWSATSPTIRVSPSVPVTMWNPSNEVIRAGLIRPRTMTWYRCELTSAPAPLSGAGCR